MSQYGLDDCPADVRAQIDRLIEELRARLSENLIGVYLHGSLAMNCFNPLRSDIDLLVVTRGAMTPEQQRGLAHLMLDISLNPARIEISFLRREDLHPWQHPAPFDFHYSEDWREKFERELKDGSWNEQPRTKLYDADLAGHVYVLNQRGKRLFGAAIGDVFPRVPKKDFIASILADVLDEKFGVGAILQNPVYVVLNACRTLAFLREERVLSKREGGEWALKVLPAQFHQIINGALDEYRDVTNESRLEKEPLLRFAEYMRNEIETAAKFIAIFNRVKPSESNITEAEKKTM